MKLAQLIKYLELLGCELQSPKLSGPNGNRLVIPCPYAYWTHESGGDTHPSMGIWLDKTGSVLCKCWACHWVGPFQDLFLDVAGLRRDVKALSHWCEVQANAAETEAARYSSIVEDVQGWGTRTFAKRAVLPELILNRLLPIESSVIGATYVHGREVGYATAKLYDLRYDGYRQRVVFPVRDVDGALVGAVGRDITGLQSLPYYNYFNFNTGTCLGGYHQALLARKSRVHVVEGYYDLLRIQPWADAEDASVVCTFTAELSKLHAAQLGYLDATVQIWYDGDAAGRSGAQRAVRTLASVGVAAKIANLPDGLDPGSMTQSEYARVLANVALQF